MKRRGGRELCIVDLAEPPDVVGLVSTLDGVTYLSLKDFDEMALETKADRAVAACEAWSIIEEEVKYFSQPEIKRYTVHLARKQATT